MIKNRIARKIGLAGLVGLLSLSRGSHADSNFSLSASVGGYSPFGNVVALDGIPYGAELEGDYGNERMGVRAGASWFTKTGDQRKEFSDTYTRNRRVLEGESESSGIARFYVGGRFGNPWAYVGLGGVAVEGRNVFETTDRKFFRQEVREVVDRKTLHGLYGEFCVGGPIKRDKKTGKRMGFFFKGTYDNFFDRDNSGGIKFSAGITFSN